MSELTHAVYDVLTGEIKSKHPNASIAFAEAAKIGGEKYGYVVGPIGMPPDIKQTPIERKNKEVQPYGEQSLFD